MNIRKNIVIKALAGFITVALALPMTACSKKENAEFTPRLDVKTNVVLDVMGFFSNFEAFDQITNDFNEIYPNVVFNYEQVGGENLDSYMAANPGVDIFMTSDETVSVKNSALAGRCADLSKEDISFEAIDKEMLEAYYCDGKQLSIPMSQNLYGIIVNVSLLEKEGLSVPQNYDEFVNALDVLKNKGYVPIQGPSSKVYSELLINMFYNMVGNDAELYGMLKAGDNGAVEKLGPILTSLTCLRKRGTLI